MALLSLIGTMHASPLQASPIVVSDSMGEINATKNLQVLRDPDQRLTFDLIGTGSEDAKFEAIERDSLGKLKGFQWFKGTLENPTSEPIAIDLQFDFASHVVMHFTAAGQLQPKVQETGWKLPFAQHKVPFLQPTLEVVVPPGTSTFVLRNESSIFSLTVGSPSVIARKSNTFELWFALSLGTFLSLGIFNLFLYFRTLDIGYFHYAVRCALISAIGAVTFNAFAKHLMPEGTITRDAIMASTAVLNTIAWLFITTKFLALEKHINKVFLNSTFYGLVALHVLAGLWGWIIPGGDPFALTKFFSPMALIWMIGMGITMCFKRSRPAYFYLPAMTIYLAGVFTVILTMRGVINATTLSYLAPSFCGTLEALLMSFGLGDKYMTAMKAANTALTAKNDELGRDLTFMMKSLNQGIFSIDDKGLIGKEHSNYLKIILDRDECAGKDAFQTLFEGVDLSEDKRAQIKNAVLLGIGEDSVFYDMNSHVLPREMTRRVAKGTQIFELDWQPLVNKDDKCDKMMVVLRDVTDLHALKVETENSQRSLQMIGQVLSISLSNYEKYSKYAYTMMAENVGAIKRYEATGHLDIELMFRNVHTIKGNSRTYGLNYISDRAHEVENYLSELRTHVKLVPDARKLLEEIESMRLIHVEYNRVIADRLRTYSVDARMDLVDVLNDLYARVEDETEVKDKFFEIAVKERVGRFYPNLHDILSPIIRSQNKTAQDLSKIMPRIVFQGENVGLNVAMETVLRSIFTQMLRNSIDHGIESPDLRKIVGKDARGTITIDIQTSLSENQLIISVFDDGAGLNLRALASKAGDGPQSDLDIANTIFQSGVSTAEVVTHISGRGVGMDIIREEISKHDGSISIAFLRPKSESGHQPFKLVLAFPLHYVLKSAIRSMEPVKVKIA